MYAVKRGMDSMQKTILNAQHFCVVSTQVAQILQHAKFSEAS